MQPTIEDGSPPRSVTTDTYCRACGRQTRPDAARCASCGALLRVSDALSTGSDRPASFTAEDPVPPRRVGTPEARPISRHRVSTLARRRFRLRLAIGGALLVLAAMAIAVGVATRGEPLDYSTYALRVSQTTDALDELFEAAEAIHEGQMWLLPASERETVGTQLARLEANLAQWSRAKAPSELRDFHKTWRRGMVKFADVPRRLSRYASTGDRDELATITAAWEEATTILLPVMDQAEELHNLGSSR